MTKRIFRTILATSFVVLLVGIAVIIGILYPYFGGQLEKELENEASYLSLSVEKDGVAALEQLPHSSSTRITLIASDGAVLYDSQADAAQMENHADREEIRDAMENGSGKAWRQSDTLDEQNIYYALRLSNGNVLRISSAQRSVVSLVLGVLQPLLVRPLLGGGYQIVAGERRWRAARMAGVSEVPVVIRDMSDHEVMELALIENLQREDLTPLEEAQGYQSLIDQYGMTQEEIARTVGKSRPAVANALRLLHLPEDLQELVAAGKLSAGHARTLLGFQEVDDMRRAAQLVVEQGISVRELGKACKTRPMARKKKSPRAKVGGFTTLTRWSWPSMNI